MLLTPSWCLEWRKRKIKNEIGVLLSLEPRQSHSHNYHPAANPSLTSPSNIRTARRPKLRKRSTTHEPLIRTALKSYFKSTPWLQALPGCTRNPVWAVPSWLAPVRRCYLYPLAVVLQQDFCYAVSVKEMWPLSICLLQNSTCLHCSRTDEDCSLTCLFGWVNWVIWVYLIDLLLVAHKLYNI